MCMADINLPRHADEPEAEQKTCVTIDEWIDVWGTLVGKAKKMDDFPMWLQYYPKVLFDVINRTGKRVRFDRLLISLRWARHFPLSPPQGPESSPRRSSSVSIRRSSTWENSASRRSWRLPTAPSRHSPRWVNLAIRLRLYSTFVRG